MLVNLVAMAGILGVSALMITAIIVSERGATSAERERADRLESILRRTTGSGSTDGLGPGRRRARVVRSDPRGPTDPYWDGGS